ncbi:MAG: hypothetical protein WCI73_16395, partial [Phycisphaerae bacterium]
MDVIWRVRPSSLRCTSYPCGSGGGHVQYSCGHGQTLSSFEVGGRLTEIVLASAPAVRLGRGITWQGEAMAVAGAPEAA